MPNKPGPGINNEIQKRDTTLKKKGVRAEAMRKRIADFENALKIGADIKTACKSAGVSRETYYYRVKKGIIDVEKVEKIKADPVLKALKTVYDNLNEGETAKWFLERRLKELFSKRSEVTGKDGEPLSPTQILIVNPTQDKKEDVEGTKAEE